MGILLKMAFALPILCVAGQVRANADPLALKLEQPQPRQIEQRTGIAPGTGYARVTIRGEAPAAAKDATWVYQDGKSHALVAAGDTNGKD